MAKTKILIILAHSTHNAGDLALLELAISQLRYYFNNAETTIASNYPDETKIDDLVDKVVPSPHALIRKNGKNSVFRQLISLFSLWIFSYIYRYMWRLSGLISCQWNTLLTAYQEADFIIALSGNQFYSTGKYGWSIFSHALSVDLAYRFSKPVYVLPQSIGPLKRWWERKLVYWLYSRANIVFLRDKSSIDLAIDIGLPVEKVHYAPDPAFTLKPAEPIEAQKILLKNGWDPKTPSIGVTIIAPMGKSLNFDHIQNYYQSIAIALTNFAISKKMQIVFFNQVTGPTAIEDDRIPTHAIYEKIKSISPAIKILNVTEVLSPSMLKACYGKMDLFLASRLHSGIFALGMYVPTIFVGYLSKTMGLLNSLGLHELGIELNVVNCTSLEHLFLTTWNSRKSLRDKIAIKILEIIPQTEQPPLDIHMDFSHKYGKR
ncbi:MAG: polysaccharide pyruvyl transferase family protein [Melioribacter sp.]|nr:polysaccharide pyruvyl transferase family protein [Melioribacter sp.]